MSTRRNGIRRGAAVVAALTVALLAPHGAAAAPPAQEFASRPDLTPPVLDVRTPAGPGVAPGYLFFAPKRATAQSAPVIMDNTGQLVWSGTKYPGATDFRVQRYRGEPVLTFWQGKADSGHGQGRFVILNRQYQEIATVRAGEGYQGDLHEFRLTPQGTALIAAYHPRPADLSKVGGPRDGWVHDGVFQEIDVATGDVRFTWRSLDHVPVTESYQPFSPLFGDGTRDAPWDYFHINSIERGANGDYLISARHTHAVYRIANTGDVRWRLGGRNSDFAVPDDARFAWQHDARFVDDDTISLFDNADDNPDSGPNRGPSRGQILDLDTTAMRATLNAEYRHPENLVSTTQGNTQLMRGPGVGGLLGGSHVLVGWGSEPRISEYAPDGRVLFDATFGAGSDSYRAYRFPWQGRPTDRPAVAARTEGDTTRVAVSWNGATEVARWQVYTGDTPEELADTTTVRRAGFETTVEVPATGYTQVRAVDALGRVIGNSETTPAR